MRFHLKSGAIRRRRRKQDHAYFHELDTERYISDEDIAEDEELKNACDSIIDMVHKSMIEKLQAPGIAKDMQIEEEQILLPAKEESAELQDKAK